MQRNFTKAIDIFLTLKYNSDKFLQVANILISFLRRFIGYEQSLQFFGGSLYASP